MCDYDDLHALDAILRDLRAQIPAEGTPEYDALLTLARTNQLFAAVSAESDPDIPDRVLIATAATIARTPDHPNLTYKVHHIKRTTSWSIEPSRPLSEVAINSWHLRRLTGRLLPTDPEPVEITADAWALICTGNAVALEGALRDCGYNAFASAPHAVKVTL